MNEINGGWIPEGDYAALKQQNAELSAQVAELAKVINEIGIEYDSLKNEPAECPDLWKLFTHLRHIAKAGKP